MLGEASAQALAHVPSQPLKQRDGALTIPVSKFYAEHGSYVDG